jgi:hypothetical protein
MKSFSWSTIALIVIALLICPGAPLPAKAAAPEASTADASAAALVAEVRRAFTLHGQPIPPEVFRDFGDGDIADSGSIWVSVDVAAAIGSNLYADAIKKERGWFVQTRANQSINGNEETAYRLIGTTDNGLLVVIASYNGGGSGTFYTLHILDVAAARGFDLEGRPYQRINLTILRSVILGDRWDGEVSIAKNSITVVTTRRGPTDNSGWTTTLTIPAERP